ncbi:MAG: lysophospholipid acyltransferase family protein, partial [Chlorobiales bacterium]|nr:lysophospholipid acyltransferase family protein [Chlorobiales bacterium]
MKKPLKYLSHWLTYVLFSGLGIVARRLSIEQTYCLAEAIANFIYGTLKLRRSLVEKNLSICFPEKPEAERAQIARDIYLTQMINLLETLRIPLIKTRDDAAKIFEVDATLIYEKALNKGKGSVLVSAHFGNWELLALCSGLLLKPITVITKAQSNSFIDRKINEWRSMHGNRMVGMKQAPRECIRELRTGGIVTMLSDQSGPKDGYFTTFLGQDASIFLGAAVFALRTGSPLLVGMCIRTGIGKYRTEIIEIPMDGLTSDDESVKLLAERYIRVIEAYVRRYPSQWFWLHNRWKRKRP